MVNIKHFQFVKIQSSHWKLYKEIRLKALISDPDAFGSTIEIESIRNDDEWKELISNTKFKRILGMYEDYAIGICGGIISEEGIEIIGMWVDPKYRRMGVAKNMIDCIEKEFNSQCYLLWVNSINTNAISLYESIGYINTNILKPFKDRPSISELKMIKKVNGENSN